MRHNADSGGGQIVHFNPRTPRGVRRDHLEALTCSGVFQSTHPARGATCTTLQAFCKASISIHAPREGCDIGHLLRERDIADFNPRTPRGVRRMMVIFNSPLISISIHAPREGCDHGCMAARLTDKQNFNPRTPRGVRHDDWVLAVGINLISIHAPREGCDYHQIVAAYFLYAFQSTHPARGATFGLPFGFGGVRYFNPRTPRGVRRFRCHCR